MGSGTAVPVAGQDLRPGGEVAITLPGRGRMADKGTGGARGMQEVGLLWGAVDRDLASALDAAALRQEAIAHNLANVETPRYRRFDVVFEEALRARQAERERRKVELARTHPAHLPPPAGRPVTPVLVRDTTSVMRNDGNNVDVEREMVALSKNTLFYQSVTRVLGARLAALRTAISEGRR